MTPQKRIGPAGNGTDSESTRAADTSQSNNAALQLRRRRRAAYRCEPDTSGCRDPWRPWRPEHLSESYVDGYRDAARHLLAQGLLPAPNAPAMRVLWGRRGADQRLARTLAEHWQVVA